MGNTFIDETGNRYGRLTIIRKTSPFKQGNKTLARWICSCECGVDCIVLGTNLRTGHQKSCGCLKRESAVNNCITSAENRKGEVANNLTNELGNRYGSLTVVAALPSKHKKARWECRCDCGKRKRATGDSLRQGKVSSCGCLRKQIGNTVHTSSEVRFSQYRSNALRRGLDFLISFEWFEKLLALPCTYCGEGGGGVDRWDNAVGYTEINSVPCCTICNRMKLTHSASIFLNQCRKVAKNHKNATDWSRLLQTLKG